MPPYVQFLGRRLLILPTTLLIVTALLYGMAMLLPVETRARMYMSKGVDEQRLSAQQIKHILDQIVETRGLNDPYPVQYARWLGNLLRGDWGWSPTATSEVLPALLRRTPVTAELTLYSVLLFVPLGLASGALAGWHYDRRGDHLFRAAAALGAAVPPFVLALVLLAVFYVGLHWFPLGRIGITESQVVRDPAQFTSFTGMLTLDGVLNNRLDIALDAARRLVLPVITLSLVHWATLGRLVRSAIIEELSKEYVLAARGRGLLNRWILWGHAFRNTLGVALTGTALSAASLVTGVFVVEIIFNFHGVSEIITRAMGDAVDVPATLGFAVYSVMAVLFLMFVLDLLQAVVDPRVRTGVDGG